MTEVVKPAEAKKLLGGTIEESRTKRLEKQQSRYRDRGGLFVPSEANPLLDLLLARGVNGESPSRKRRAEAGKSPSRSPSRARQTTEPASPAKKRVVSPKKSKAKKAPAKEASTKAKSRPTKPRRQPDPPTENPAEENVQPIAGPSQVKKAVTRKRGRPAKEVTDPSPDVHVDDASHVPTVKKPKATRKRKVEVEDPDRVDDEGSKHAASGSKSKGPERATYSGSLPKSPTAHSQPKASKSKKATSPRKPRESKRERQGGRSDTLTSGEKAAVGVEETSEGDKPVPPPPPKIAEERQDVKGKKAAPTGQEVEDADTQLAAPRRKRPKLYVPSDTESDDEPILARFQAKKAHDQAASKTSDSNEAHTTTKAAQSSNERKASGANINTIVPPIPQLEARQATSESGPRSDIEHAGTSGKHKEPRPGSSSKAPARKIDGDLETAPAMAKSKTVGKRRRADHAGEVPDQPEQDTEAAKARVERPAKKRKGRDTDATGTSPVAETEPLEPTKSKTNKEKRTKKPAKKPVQKAKGLKPASRRQKENKKAQKDSVPMREPKPRLSMFPAPCMALDSDDEIDFLR